MSTKKIPARSRNSDGTVRKKRGDTLVGTIEKKYNKDFKVRSDKQLKNLLKDRGASSLSELLFGE